MQLIKHVLRTCPCLLACKIFMKLVAVFLRSKFEWSAIFERENISINVTVDDGILED